MDVLQVCAIEKHNMETLVGNNNDNSNKIGIADGTRAVLPNKETNHAPISNAQINSVISHLHEQDEVNAGPSNSPREMECSEQDTLSPAVRKSRSALILDDSDSDNEFHSNKEPSNVSSQEEIAPIDKSLKCRRITVLHSDSDSDSENVKPITPHSASSVNENAIDDTPSVNMMDSKNKAVPKSRLATLCSSDSDEEPICEGSDNEIIEQTQHQEQTNVKSKSRSKKAANLPKKMTAKEAAEQRKEIQSESQRMLREKNISLPYHKSKCRSLKEFLSRRPKLSRTLLPSSRAPSVAIKMSSEQLEVISKKLKEREREVREFYKSGSESDNEDDGDANGVALQVENSTLEADVEGDVNKNSDFNKVQLSENVSSDSANNCDIVNDVADLHSASDPAKENEVEKHGGNEPCSDSAMDIDETPSLVEVSDRLASESYDFQLESENPEKLNDNRSDNAVIVNKSNFTYTDLDREIENYGNPQKDKPAPPPPIKSKLEILKEKLANDKPKLSGGPNDVIDLESGLTKPREVVQLMERFAKHVTAINKHQSKHRVKLSIVTVESGGDVRREEVAMNVDSDEEPAAVEEKPGAKLLKLKEELQRQMKREKIESWRQKAAGGIRGAQDISDDRENGEKDILDYDEEEEAEMTDEEETGDEEEIDELEDRPKKKSREFLNEEAEVSDEEEEYKDAISEDEEDEAQISPEQPEGSEGTKKVLKRILQPVDDDSDDEDLFNESVLHKSATTNNVHLDSTITADEDDIPSHQPRPPHTPIRPAVSQTKSIADFLTPISFITSIQNLASTSKNIKSGPAAAPFTIPGDTDSIPPKKLFSDSETFGSQVSIGCSSQTQESLSDQEKFSHPAQEPSIEEPPSTQDLLGICSGEFTGVTQSGPRQLTSDSQSSEAKSLGQEDAIISQLLDEEELEDFKKKFESPEKPSSISQRSEAKEITGGGIIDSDDDDDDEEDTKLKKKKKKQKRIQFSDDEDSEEEEETGDQEVIDLQDRDDDDIDNVDYDSEENEIDLKEEEGKREKLQLKDFLENEAELSESEWGSEDEDENDLDRLEFELGDTEKFDEEKMKADLEKIHMRRMLDDDTREVKLLQELLLEDGEMHGTGRQRQFKWKNIDSNAEEDGEAKKDDDALYLDDEDGEEQWRKRRERHEREMFLLKQQQQQQQQQKSQNSESGEDSSCTSQLLKLGQKFLRRSASNNSQNNETPFKSSFFSLQSKRGSFLNRSGPALQRVAEYTKVTGTVVDANSRKTTKHFLFQSVNSAEVSAGSNGNKKRKATDGTPNAIKKLRLTANLSPAVKKKSDGKSDRAKKLFNF